MERVWLGSLCSTGRAPHAQAARWELAILWHLFLLFGKLDFLTHWNFLPGRVSAAADVALTLELPQHGQRGLHSCGIDPKRGFLPEVVDCVFNAFLAHALLVAPSHSPSLPWTLG